MPFIAVLHLAVAIFFINHAYKTGRPQYWYFILLSLPLVGSIAYVCFELLPELGQTRRGREVKQGISDLIAPDREFKRLHEEAKTTDSVEAKQALAAECERKGMWREAIQLYASAAQGMYADDPVLLTGLARAHLANGTARTALDILERLRAAHPDLDSQDAHLAYARCLEELGRIGEAETEYKELSAYYIGLEARTRYGLILLKQGRPEQARAMFETVVRASQARGVVLSDGDKTWLKVARSNLA